MEFSIISPWFIHVTSWFIIDLFKTLSGLKICVGGEGSTEISLNPRVLTTCKKNLDTAKVSQQPYILTEIRIKPS